MKTITRIFTFGLMLAASQFVVAQAPAGATGVCKDGSYTTNATKKGACSGHKGVKEWYANGKAASDGAPAAATPATTTPAPTGTDTQTPAKTSAKGTQTSPAPGGGAGQVWLNTTSNVYHCSGSRFYGKTKSGAYMSEADAKAKGARPDHGKACGQ